MPNLNLIPRAPVFSEAEMTNAIVTELCSGRKFIAETEKFREQDVAQRAQRIRDHGKNTGAKFKHVGCIPQEDYLLLATDKRYGPEAWDDKEFVRWYFKKHPHHKTADF